MNSSLQSNQQKARAERKKRQHRNAQLRSTPLTSEERASRRARRKSR